MQIEQRQLEQIELEAQAAQAAEAAAEVKPHCLRWLDLSDQQHPQSSLHTSSSLLTCQPILCSNSVYL